MVLFWKEDFFVFPWLCVKTPDQGINKLPFLDNPLTLHPHDSRVPQSFMAGNNDSGSFSSESSSAQKCTNPSALELGPQKKL